MSSSPNKKIWGLQAETSPRVMQKFSSLRYQGEDAEHDLHVADLLAQGAVRSPRVARAFDFRAIFFSLFPAVRLHTWAIKLNPWLVIYRRLSLL